MQRKGWYLVAYDIACPRRLVKVHRLLKREGIAAQKSLFLVNGAEYEIEALMDRIAKVMASKMDDLRAYPISNPSELWTNTENPLAGLPLLYIGVPDQGHRVRQKGADGYPPRGKKIGEAGKRG